MDANEQLALWKKRFELLKKNGLLDYETVFMAEDFEYRDVVNKIREAERENNNVR